MKSVAFLPEKNNRPEGKPAKVKPLFSLSIRTFEHF